MPTGRLEGHVTDMGDVLRVERWVVKGLGARLFVWRVGTPIETSEEDRKSVPGTTGPSNGKVDLIVDLQADKKVTLSGAYTDEVGNPVDPPTNATVAYTVDDAAVIALTDNGDGTAVAAATGQLGVANVHAEASFGEGQAATGDLQIVVVAGLAERFNVAASEPSEVTPDA